MAQHNEKKRHGDTTLTFETASELWKRCEEWDKRTKYTGHRESQGRDQTWYGTSSYQEAMKLGQYGWEDGAERIRLMAQKLEAKISNMICEPKLEWDTSGECPDVGAFLTGLPENMITIAPTPGARVIKLVVNITPSSGISADVIFRRGAVACAVVDAIEKAGMRVEVVAMWRTRNTDATTFTINATVKKADEPLNMDRLSYLLAHPSFPRRQVFGIMETEVDAENIIGYGYGIPVEADEKDKGDIYLPKLLYGDKQYASEESAERFTVQLLKKFNIIEEN